MLALAYLGRIAAREFFDPDDALRLVQVRDLLAGQGWYDLAQHRIDPPGGTPMHWSRLVDLPLALVIAALTPLLGQYGAETAALVAIPLVTLGCVMALAMRIAARFFDQEVSVLAGLCAVLVPATLAQLTPLRIDHHGWQIACVMLAAASPMLVRSANHAAALAGLAMALGLTISIEGLPLAAAIGAVLAWGWLASPATDRRLGWYMAALAGGLAVLFAGTRGPAALQPWCDAIAPAHIAFLLTVAAVTGLTAAFAPARRGFALAALAISAAAGAALFYTLAPGCIGAPMGQMDPLVYQHWYRNIDEGMPVWHQAPGQAAAAGVPVLLALAALVLLWRQAHGTDRRLLGEYLVLFGAALLTGLLVWRSIAFAGALGALGLGWLLNRILTWARQDPTAHRRGALPLRYLSLFAAILLVGALLLWPSSPDQAARSPVAKLAGASSGCDLPRSVARLGKLPAQTVFAPLDLGPAILAGSHHAVVASSHHRANLAIRDVISAFIDNPDKARAIAARHGASLLVLCASAAEPNTYAHHAPGGLMADLLAGRVPDWLVPIDLGQPKGFRIYRVINQP